MKSHACQIFERARIVDVTFYIFLTYICLKTIQYSIYDLK